MTATATKPRKRGGFKRQRRFPLEPLMRAARVDTLPALAEAVGRPPRTITRWSTEGGVPEWSADEAAVALGLTPTLIWPDYLAVTVGE